MNANEISFLKKIDAITLVVNFDDLKFETQKWMWNIMKCKTQTKATIIESRAFIRVNSFETSCSMANTFPILRYNVNICVRACVLFLGVRTMIWSLCLAIRL